MGKEGKSTGNQPHQSLGELVPSSPSWTSSMMLIGYQARIAAATSLQQPPDPSLTPFPRDPLSTRALSPGKQVFQLVYQLFTGTSGR